MYIDHAFIMIEKCTVIDLVARVKLKCAGEKMILRLPKGRLISRPGVLIYSGDAGGGRKREKKGKVERLKKTTRRKVFLSAESRDQEATSLKVTWVYSISVPQRWCLGNYMWREE